MSRYARFEAPDPLVEHAWVVRHDDADLREILLPDGRGLLQVVQGPAVRTDVLGGQVVPDVTGVRGIATRAVVRTQTGPGVRLGVQLHPLALARLGLPPLVDRWVAADQLVDVEGLEVLLDAGDDEAAVRVALAALDSVPRRQDDELERFAQVVALVDAHDGLVSAAELARAAEVTVSELYRWSERYLGVPPARYLAGVRFTAFVRESVGTGPVRSPDVLAVLRWYLQAGQPPREVERFTGLAPVDLRRVVDRLAAQVEPVAG